jgi:hypothetical protein
MIRRQFAACCAAVVVGCLAVVPSWAAEKIGIAAAVQNEVTADGGRALAPGGAVFRDETIRTGAKSMTQLIFLDETTLSVGPHSEVKLDRFVYSPGVSAGDVVLSTTKGAFRFITGSQDPRSYQINTPFANIGVRGTIVDCYTADNGTYCTTQEGAVVLVIDGKEHRLLPGKALFIGTDGKVAGPFTPDGQFFQIAGVVPWPLYGAYLPGDEPYNGGPDISGRLDEIFQPGNGNGSCATGCLVDQPTYCDLHPYSPEC